MDISYISKYRSEIQGMAMLWIMLFHSQININDCHILKFFKTIGYGGVDFFFFLSGFGLACSWLKNKYRISTFYVRRLIKVIPSYWLAVVIIFITHFTITHQFKPKALLLYLSGIHFLALNDSTFWFIPCILICYLSFPFIILLYTRYSPAYVLIGLTFSGVLLSLAITQTPVNHLLILSIRLPVFVFGVHTGYIFFHKTNSKSTFSCHPVINLILPGLAITLLFLIIKYTDEKTRWQYGLWWYPLLLFPYSMCLIVSKGWSELDKYFKDNPVVLGSKRTFSFLGKYSLEIYLIHIVVYQYGPYLYKKLPSIANRFNYHRFPEFLIYSIMSFGMAFTIKKMLNSVPIIRKNT